MPYYYSTNGDGTTYGGFKPFANGDYVKAPDWVNDGRECGAALHVVSDNPLKCLLWTERTNPKFYRVIPIAMRPENNGKFRCRALRRLREISLDEIFQDGAVTVEVPNGNELTYNRLGDNVVLLKDQSYTYEYVLLADGTVSRVATGHVGGYQGWSPGWNQRRLDAYRRNHPYGNPCC